DRRRPAIKKSHLLQANDQAIWHGTQRNFVPRDLPCQSLLQFPLESSQISVVFGAARIAPRWRSEEHTSELQSLAYLVCRLLLEKKKNTTPKTSSNQIH